MKLSLPRNQLVPLIVACALFMENLDGTVIATALPTMSQSLHEDPLHLSFAITSYLLSLAIFIPLSGWIADRYGARRVFRNAIVIFTLGSICCAGAQNMSELIVARLLQGLGGALMVPVGRLILLREIPKSELVSALSYLTVPALLAPLLGPPFGGLIVTYASWRWIFLINLPIGMLGWWLVSRFIQDSRESVARPLDLAGWMVLGGGVASLMLGFENFGKHLLPTEIPPLALVAGLVLIGLYVHHAQHDTAPIISLDLLKLETFRSAVTGGSMFRIGVGAYTLLLPMMLQLGFGLDALHSGLISFYGAAGALLMKPIAPRLTRRVGFRKLLVSNSIFSGAALIACGWLRPELPYLLMAIFLLITGFMRSMQFTCINAIAFSDVDEQTMSQASSFSGTAQQLSLSIGVGLGSQILNASLGWRHATALATSDFTAAFCIVGAISLLGTISFARLKVDAGEAVSGHRLAMANTPENTGSK